MQIIHTVNDPRCPLEQAELFIDKLKTTGKKEGEDYEVYIVKDYGYWSTDIAFRKQVFSEQLNFFRKNL